MKRKVVVLSILVSLLLGTAWLFGSATYKWNVPPGLSIGDILYADRKGRLTNLNAGATGTVAESAGLLTAPAYVAKNTFRVASFNFANASATQTATSDNALCFYWVATYAAGGAASIKAPATTGKVFYLRNGSGQAINVLVSGKAGVSVATGAGAMIAYDSMTGDYVKISSVLAP